MKVLEFENIHRAYQRGVDVLQGVSFSIEAGEVLGLLGKNGAGKTTLIRVALGLLECREGSVRVFGLDPRRCALEVKRRVGYVSEDQILPEFITVGELIRLHRGLYPTWDEPMERRFCERFEMDLRAKVRTLSKGQARQVALLCAVAHRPELLLLDEPAGGLDPSTRREFLEASLQLLNDGGTTILFSSHHMTDVERMAGRAVMLSQGRLLIDSTLDNLRENYSLALVPHTADERLDRLRVMPDCLSVRRQFDTIHAIFRLESQACRCLLKRELGIADACCTSIPLEEMFIELAGGRS